MLNERSKSQYYFIHVKNANHGAGLGWGKADVAVRTQETEQCWPRSILNLGVHKCVFPLLFIPYKSLMSILLSDVAIS